MSFKEVVWTHLKTGNNYYIRDFGLREDDLEPMVIYTGFDRETAIFIRPATEFFDGRFLMDQSDGVVGEEVAAAPVNQRAQGHDGVWLSPGDFVAWASPLARFHGSVFTVHDIKPDGSVILADMPGTFEGRELQYVEVAVGEKEVKELATGCYDYHGRVIRAGDTVVHRDDQNPSRAVRFIVDKLQAHNHVFFVGSLMLVKASDYCRVPA